MEATMNMILEDCWSTPSLLKFNLRTGKGFTRIKQLVLNPEALPAKKVICNHVYSAPVVIGRCFTEYTCTICKAKKQIDSSD